jgi:hypothetical protein
VIHNDRWRLSNYRWRLSLAEGDHNTPKGGDNVRLLYGDQDMKQVFVARTPAEAHLVKGVLEARGIRAEVRGEALWGTRGAIPLTPDTLPTVWVLDDLQAPEGVRIVEEYSSSAASASGLEAQGWRCPACGEQLEPQFSECWKCGASRPA